MGTGPDRSLWVCSESRLQKGQPGIALLAKENVAQTRGAATEEEKRRWVQSEGSVDSFASTRRGG